MISTQAFAWITTLSIAFALIIQRRVIIKSNRLIASLKVLTDAQREEIELDRRLLYESWIVIYKDNPAAITVITDWRDMLDKLGTVESVEELENMKPELVEIHNRLNRMMTQ